MLLLRMKKLWLCLAVSLYAALAAAPVVAQSIAVTLTESSLSLTTGGSAKSVGVSVSRSTFDGAVSLSVSSLPSGVEPSIVHPGTGNSGTVTLQATTTAAPVSNQTVTVTASGSGVAPVSATFSLTVIVAGVTITALSETSVTLTAGGAERTILVSISRTNFVGSVTLSVDGLPAGVTPAIIQPGSGNSGSITLRPSSNATLVTNQAVTITASGSGVASGTATFLLTVNNTGITFSSLSETSVVLKAGGPASAVTVSISRINFSGDVTLAVSQLPAGVTATLSQPGAGNTGSVTLQAAENVNLFRNQTITLIASGAGIAPITTTFLLTVLPAVNVTFTLSETTVLLTAGGAARTIQVTISRIDFVGSVSLSVSGLPAGVGATIAQPGTGNSASITLQASASAAPLGNQAITITASSGDTTLGTTTFRLSVTTSGVAISALSSAELNLTIGGEAQTINVTISRINFGEAVTLSVTGLPSGVTATFTQPGTGNSGSITLQAAANATSARNQTITITASGSGIPPATASLLLTALAVPGLRIASFSPTSVILVPGAGAQTVQVTITRIDFIGSAELSVSGLPAGVTATFTQPGTGNVGSIILQASLGTAPVSNQTVTVTASSAGVASGSATLPLTVAPGGITIVSISRTSVTLVAGGLAEEIAVDISRINFSGEVTLSVSELPPGVVATFRQPGTGSTGFVTLQATSNATSTNQNITITASSPGIPSATATVFLITNITVVGLSFNPNPVTGGSPTTGTVTLMGVASPVGSSVSLTSVNTLVQVPANAVVPPGSSAGTFIATTSRGPSDPLNVNVTATLNATAQATLTLIRELRVSSLGFQPNPVTGGNPTTGTVLLTGLAPAGGATVTLTSNDPLVQVPAAVIIPEGSGSATFTATTGRTTGPVEIRVRADLEVGVAATLTVLPITPNFTVEGVTNAASFVTGITPGSIVTIFGTNLTRDVSGIVSGPAGVFPLPTDLRGTSVTVNGIAAPLFAIVNVGGREQINLQVPFEVVGQSTVSLVVNNNGVTSAPVQATLLNAHPGVFTVDGTAGVIVHSNFQLVSASSPAARDEVVIAYATGLGPVSQTPRTGMPALRSPLSLTLLPPTVTVGGIVAEVLFSGLAPDFAGLFQVNFRIPRSTPSGNLDVVIQVSGQNSKPVKMAVQ